MQKEKNNIIIFSRPIRSGKTTELMDFITNKNVGGFLTPDKDGKRLLYDIDAENFHEFEIDERSIEPAISIGKFRFSANAFNKAKELFNTVQNYNFFIVDEVGKLEILQHKGFEPELSLFIKQYKAGERKGMLLLVVRETLVDAAVSKYELKNARVIHSKSSFSLW